MQNYSLYMDESGTFNASSQKEPYLVLGILVPDSIADALREGLANALIKHKLPRRLHAAEYLQKPGFKNYLADCISLMEEYLPTIFCCRRTPGTPIPDIYRSMPELLYTDMALNTLEHVLMLAPSLWGQDLAISLHPNSRSMSQLDERQAAWFRQAGFGIRYDEYNKTYRAFVFTNDMLRTFVQRLFLDLIPVKEVTGRREFPVVETVVAGRSDEPLVSLVDSLAWIARGNAPELASRLEACMDINLLHGTVEKRYRTTAQAFLRGEYGDCLLQLQSLPGKLPNEYYRRALRDILTRCTAALAASPAASLELEQVERFVSWGLDLSWGNWETLLHLTNMVLDHLESMPQTLQLRFLNHAVRLHNHRGEHRAAMERLERIRTLRNAASSLDLTEWRADLETLNRTAVAGANIFDFSTLNGQLESAIERLEGMRRLAETPGGPPIRDELMGKLLGTLGQNYAFRARANPEAGVRARECFRQAKGHFLQEKDLQRQDVYLLHLATDLGDARLGREALASLGASPDIAAFLDAPTPENAPGQGFLLHALLRHLASDAAYGRALAQQYSPERLQELFADKFSQHPFQFICGFMGTIAGKAKEITAMRAYFSSALEITTKHMADSPLFTMLHAQVLARQGLAEHLATATLQAETMHQLLGTLDKVANNPEAGNMLQLEGNTAVGGHFAAAYNALRAVHWETDFDVDAVRHFLDCFTFNYQ